jgi:hypothetical protein
VGGGTVLRRAGADWSEETLGSQYELAGGWSTDGLSIAVGRYAPNHIDWEQAILMNTGPSWGNVGPVGTAHRLFDVWGRDATDVYAVGWAGEVLHYNGVVWSVADGGSGNTAYLKSVSGTYDTVIAVGRTDDLRGMICQYDGLTWVKTTLNDTEELFGVWVESATSAFAVGAKGAIRRFDGTLWHKVNSPTQTPLLCVWGSSRTDIYAGGINGTLIHYDGTVWRELLPATNRSINAISGQSSNNVLLAGDKGSILLLEGL